MSLPSVPDAIPSYAQDLALENEDTNNMDWSIDRRPENRNIIQNRRIIHYEIQYGIIQYEMIQYEMIRRRTSVEPTNQDTFNIKLSISETNEEEFCKECVICYEETIEKNKVTLNCGHKFCGICIKKLLIKCNERVYPSCSLCRTKMSEFVVNNQETYDLVKEFCN
jgi:hypothetical protein